MEIKFILHELCSKNFLLFFFYFYLIEASKEILNLFFFSLKVSAAGKGVLVTGCESPLAWALAKKLDEMGFSVFAGFTKKIDSEEADLLKEESSGRMQILQLDVTSEVQVIFVENIRLPDYKLHVMLNPHSQKIIQLQN